MSKQKFKSLSKEKLLRAKRNLRLGKRYTVAEIKRQVENSRKQPIRILKVKDMPLDVSGLWVASANRDTILCPSQTSQAHIEHIILHELSHMILGHRPVLLKEDSAALDSFVKSTTPEAISKIARSTYTRPEEVEAEMLATMLSIDLDHTPTKDFWTDLRSREDLSSNEILLSHLDEILKEL